MYVLRLSRQFIKDLESLPKPVQNQANKALRNLERDPYHPGLESHSQASIHRRKAMRSKVNDFHRILWEWGEGGAINLWRVGHHDLYKGMNTLPTEAGANWQYYQRNEADGSAEKQHDWRQDLREPQPFRNVPDNHLRLFGVPEQHLTIVKGISDPEAIWDLPIAENVRYTLYNVLAIAEDWTADHLLDTSQLLFRATADQLEGYCEGKIKQLMLNLNEEQQTYVEINTNGPLLIKGVAGSGKTTIGLYRAHYLACLIEEQGRMFGEGASVLLLTYSRTLTKALKQLYVELYGEDLPYTVAVEGYKEWMLQRLHSAGMHFSEANRQTRRKLVDNAKNEVAAKYPDDKVVRNKYSQFLLDEFDKVIRARRISSLNEYQAIDRIGRGSALDRDRHRPIVWEIYEHYQQKLDQLNLFDWADLARLVKIRCQPLPQFDVVIVDEAQDLPPSDLHLASKLISDYKGIRGLTLLADPAQSIYYRGIPWKEAGINIQGRTRILAKNFRNTRQILQAARPIVESCEDLRAQDEFIPPFSTDLPGPRPVVASYEEYANSIDFVEATILRHCQDGKFRPGDIAVLARMNQHRNFTAFSDLKKRLSRADIPWSHYHDDGFEILENQVKLISMHSAKGLEFPIVFILDLDADRFPNIFWSSETKAEDELQERKLFYVSMTRAAERLYLLHPQRNRSPFLYDLDESTIRRVSC